MAYMVKEVDELAEKDQAAKGWGGEREKNLVDHEQAVISVMRQKWGNIVTLLIVLSICLKSMFIVVRTDRVLLRPRKIRHDAAILTNELTAAL